MQKFFWLGLFVVVVGCGGRSEEMDRSSGMSEAAGATSVFTNVRAAEVPPQGGAPSVDNVVSSSGSVSVAVRDDDGLSEASSDLLAGSAGTTGEDETVVSDAATAGSGGSVATDDGVFAGSAGIASSIDSSAGASGASPVEDCSSRTIRYAGLDSIEEMEVSAGYLEFSLNVDSPSGEVDSGLQEVLRIDATAHCGDIVLEQIHFQTATDIFGAGWFDRLADHDNGVVSGITYEYQGVYFFHGYGPAHASVPEQGIDNVFWDHTFDQGIRILSGETFTFSLRVSFEDASEESVQFRLLQYSNWYGVDDPSAYPDNVISDIITGNELIFFGSTS